MSIPNYIPILDKRIELQSFSNVKYGSPGLNSVSGGLPKKYLEIGDIIKFGYIKRTKSNNYMDTQRNVLNPIVICCGFERNRVHGIDLSVLDDKAQGSELQTKFYTDYKMKYYPGGKRKDVPLIDVKSFNSLSLNSGEYGNKDIIKFYRSYNISKIKNRSVIIINIDQAIKDAGQSRVILP